MLFSKNNMDYSGIKAYKCFIFKANKCTSTDFSIFKTEYYIHPSCRITFNHALYKDTE